MALLGRHLELLDGTGTDRDASGAKAWALDRLVEHAFAVPAALVIHASAYRLFAASEPVCSIVDQLRRSPIPPSASAAQAEMAIEATFVDQPLPVELGEEIVDSVGPMLEEGAVVVRSSATAEDSAGTSSAGQYRSYLGLRSLDGVFGAVRRCWASLWFPAARSYRESMEIDDGDLAMAVIVQQQVPAEWSGVMFTRDPQGDGSTMRIESVPGFGEDLVSGRVTPADFVVDRRSLLVVARRQQPPPFLEDVARLGLRVERRIGGPQDVEWSIAGGRIWVLQSRPITVSSPLALDDDGGDTPVRAADTFTPQGVAEMLPGVLSPLVWSINRPMLDDAFRAMFQSLGAAVPDADRPVVARFRGRCALNLSVARDAAASLSSSAAAEVDAAYLGPDHEVPVAAERGTGGVSLRSLVRNWRAQRQIEDEVRVLCTAVSCLELIEPNPRGLEVSRLLAYRRELRDLAWRGVAAELAASTAASSAYRSLELLLGRWLGDDVGPETAQRATSGSLAHTMVGPMRLRRIRTVLDEHSTPSLDRVIDDGLVSTIRARLLGEDGGGLVSAIEEAAHRFGSIAVYAGPTFAEEPNALWQMVRAQRAAPVRTQEPKGAVDVLAETLGSSRRWLQWRILSGQIVDVRRRLLARMTDDAIRFLGLREEAKAALLGLGGMERRVIVDGAERLVRSGHLTRIEDVDLLTDAELEELLLDGEPVGTLDLERRALARAAARRGRPLPTVFTGAPEASLAKPDASDVLEGWAASPGRARGRVRRIRDLSDGDALQPGEIMVATSTDPSWTPLMVCAGGIVLEQGGPLSHAAIVARELRLPAVLNVADAVQRLQDGDLVEVDGTRGVVSVVAPTPADMEVRA